MQSQDRIWAPCAETKAQHVAAMQELPKAHIVVCPGQAMQKLCRAAFSVDVETCCWHSTMLSKLNQPRVRHQRQAATSRQHVLVVPVGTVEAPAAAAVSSLLHTISTELKQMGYSSEAHSCASMLPS